MTTEPSSPAPDAAPDAPAGAGDPARPDDASDAAPDARGASTAGADLRVEHWDGGGEAWDDFVRAADGWTHFHLHGWKGIMEGVLGHGCPYLAARGEGGELRGVLPLVRVKSLVFGHYLVSMPFLNYGGPLGDDEAVAALARRAARLAREEGADLMEMRARRELPVELPASHRKITVLRDLPEDPEVLWDDLRSKVRSQVRKPRKEGVEFRFGHDQVAPFHEVFAHHMHALGTPAQGRDLFEAIASTFGEDAWFGCAWMDGTPVACGAALRWGDEVEMTWASDLFEYRSIAPNMGLYWAFMERAVGEGCSVFNFGRCDPGSGTHRFKKQWGTRDQQLWWYQEAPGGLDATPSPDDDRWSWGPEVWRRLPEPVARALGPRIVRLIP